MTSHVVRLYALAATVVVFFVAWAAIAAHPWQAAERTAQSPQLARLAAREHRLREEAAQVQRIVKRRWAVYNRKLKAREHQIATVRRQNQLIAAQRAAAPSVRVVTLPAVTVTRSS